MFCPLISEQITAFQKKAFSFVSTGGNVDKNSQSEKLFTLRPE